MKSAGSAPVQLSRFCVQSPDINAKSFVCFLLDINCDAAHAELEKHLFTTALHSVSGNQRFVCALLSAECISFLVVVNGKIKSISFDFQHSLFDFIDVEYILNDANDVNCICSFIEGLNKFSGMAQHEIPELKMFSSAPKKHYFKVMVFSSNYICSNSIPNASVDWVSIEPTEKMHIDGFNLILTHDKCSKIEIQIQTMVTKYFNNYLFGLKVKIYMSDQVVVKSPYFEKESVPFGYSELVKVIIPKISSASSVLIQVVSSYITFNEKHPLVITNVFSKKYQTSHDYLPFLSSINPSILRPKFKNQNNPKAFILKLNNAYQNKIVNLLPGNRENDYYFSLIPKLQWLLRIAIKKSKFSLNTFMIERGHELVEFCPLVSFWENQNSQIEKISFFPERSNILLGKPPIVIVDTFNSVRIYMNEKTVEGSLLDKYIKECLNIRFPIPEFRIITREKFEIDCKFIFNDINEIKSIYYRELV